MFKFDVYIVRPLTLVELEEERVWITVKVLKHLVFKERFLLADFGLLELTKLLAPIIQIARDAVSNNDTIDELVQLSRLPLRACVP